MTEGNIANWKLKEGDSYVAGDVILEIETDKATMDVEAQDDGILGKILVADGAKSVQVGHTIAIMAEEGDDLSNLEVASPAPKAEESVKETKSEAKPDSKKSEGKSTEKVSKSESSSPTGPTQSPAVASLLKQFNISDASQITATGPKGRLLKADVLVHAQKIQASTSRAIQEAYTKRTKMDLSNIKLAPPPPHKVKKETPVVEEVKVVELKRTVSLQHLVLFSERVSEDNAIDITVEELAAKAAARALNDVPQFGLAPKKKADVAFDEILGIKKNVTRLPALTKSTVPVTLPLDISEYLSGGIIGLPSRIPSTTLFALNVVEESKQSKPVDVLDFLTGSMPSPKVVPRKSTIASLSFVEGSMDRDTASLFLDRTAQYLESPSHLLL